MGVFSWTPTFFFAVLDTLHNPSITTMKFVSFLLAATTLFTTAAIPMQPSAPLGPNHVPNVDFGHRPMTKNDRMATKDMIISHHQSLELGNECKTAKLAYAQKGWLDGVGPDDQHKQYLNFDYHREDTPDSKIGQTVTLSRDRPLPEPHFGGTVPKEHKPEIAKEMEKHFKALPPDQAKYVRSMKAHGGWVDGPGLREETQFTYHYKVIPLARNTLWDPTTIYRPMSFHIDDAVPKADIPNIKKRVREEHEKLDEGHPFKHANYGVVTQGWRREAWNGDQVVGATLYNVKDKLSDDSEEDFKKIGVLPVALGHLGKDNKSKASSSSAGSAT